MATKKPLKAAKPVAKTNKLVKPTPKKAIAKTVKTAKPVKKVAAVKSVSKKIAPPVKGKATVAKKVAPAKKAVVAKKEIKPAKKAVVVKKAAAVKKIAVSKKVVVVKKSVAIKKESPKNNKGTKVVTVSKKAPLVKKQTAKLPAKEIIKKKVVITNPKKSKEPVKKTPIVDKKVSKVAVQEKKSIVAAKPEKVSKPVEKVAKSKPAPVEVPKPVVEKSAKAATKKVSEKPAKPVVIPKTSTNKKVDYEPDFMKSVLDAPEPEPQSPTMRYSDQELNEFRELINKKLDSAKKELAYLQGLITRRDEMGGDETDNRYVTMEDGGMSMEREQLSQMASRQITFIDHLEKALMRIENKTYGICRVTGKLIDKARLRAVPHATLSMEAKLGIVPR